MVICLLGMKVHIPFIRIFKLWLAIFFVGAAVLFLALISFFLKKWELLQIASVIAYVVVMILILILAVTTQYYEINKKDITDCKFGKKFVYFYSEIIYIDEEQSLKSKVLTFITNRGKVIYLNFDKEGLIYKAAISKCKNLVSLQEIKTKYPYIKI